MTQQVEKPRFSGQFRTQALLGAAHPVVCKAIWHPLTSQQLAGGEDRCLLLRHGIFLVSTEDICPASTDQICLVSTEEICPVSIELNCPISKTDLSC